MTQFLIGTLVGLIVGIFIGGYLVYKFNPKDIAYNIGKVKAKKGGVIDVDQIANVSPVKKKRKLFNFKNRRNRND